MRRQNSGRDASILEGAIPSLPDASDGFREQNSTLRDSTRAAYASLPSHNAEDAAGNRSTPAPAELENPLGFRHEACLPEHLVLAPRIVVTPEYEALDDGVVILWAAVQVSAQLRRANTSDQERYGSADGWVTTRGHGLSARGK